MWKPLGQTEKASFRGDSRGTWRYGDGVVRGKLDSAGSERRSFERYAIEWAVDCYTEENFLFASITDISEMGIFVSSPTPFEEGTLVSLKFTPPELPAFSLIGKVAWVNRPKVFSQRKSVGMGIQFVDLSRADRERLVQTIRTIAYVPDFSN